MPLPFYSFIVRKEGVGKLTLELAHRAFHGGVLYVDQIEAWLEPATSNRQEQRVLLVGVLPSGETAVFETTLDLFRQACRELGDEH